MVAREIIEHYVGIPYQPGVFDCADLVIRVQREVFGREIALPQDRVRRVSLLARVNGIRLWRRRLASPTNKMADGHGVLLAMQRYPTHIGVLFEIAGEWWVLHCAGKEKTVLTRVRELPLSGWHVEGVYAWI